MHREVLREVLLVGLGRAGPADDAGVVDQHVETAEVLERGFDQGLRPRCGGHVAVVGDRLATGGDDLTGHRVGDSGVRALPVHRTAEVVDHHAGASRREKERIGTAEPATRSGDDGDPPLEPQGVQAATGASNPSSRAKVPPRIGSRSAAGTSANRLAINALLPRNVPSAWG